MKVTTFKANNNSQEKHDRNYHGTTKIANVDTMKTQRLGTMLICEHCGENWNEHAPSPVGKAPAGMCLTETNFKATGTYLLS